MSDIQDIKRNIIAACEEDHVGLWELVRIVERQMPDKDAPQIRNATLELLQDLLSAGKIEAGFPSQDGLGFAAWKVPIAAIMATLKKEWTPERRPTIGEIAWFTTRDHVRQTV